MCESLESRTLFSVTLNASGATVITPSASDRVIYVSSSTGNDKNNGLSPQSPVATFGAAEKLMRNHTGDEMLLKTGDVWHGGFGYWSASGASAQDPMVIGSYGTGARPEIMTGTGNGFTTGRSSAPIVNYVAVMGINFIADGRDPNLTKTPAGNINPSGVVILTTSNDILIENCETQYYTVEHHDREVLLYAPERESSWRSVIVDSYSTNSHSQGLYALGVNGLTIEGNFFDQNGYNNQIPGAGPTWYNQDCYINSTNTGVVIDDNIFSLASRYEASGSSGRNRQKQRLH